MPTRQPLDSGSGQEILIQMEGLVKNFGKLEVLKGIDLNVRKGDVIVLIGPSGSGKSTLLRSINLLEKPTAGKIIFEGHDVTQAGQQELVMGKHLPDHVCIAHNARLNALGHPCAAAGVAAKFLDILGTKFAVHIFRRVFESVDIHGYLLVKMKKPGKWIVRRFRFIRFYRSWLRWRFF